MGQLWQYNVYSTCLATQLVYTQLIGVPQAAALCNHYFVPGPGPLFSPSLSPMPIVSPLPCVSLPRLLNVLLSPEGPTDVPLPPSSTSKNGFVSTFSFDFSPDSFLSFWGLGPARGTQMVPYTSGACVTVTLRSACWHLYS